MTFTVGEVIVVKVGGKEYETVIDDRKVQRFRQNQVLAYLLTIGLDMNKVALGYALGKFSQREYAEFNMALGYSVAGFRDLSSFEDMEIENPLWRDG